MPDRTAPEPDVLELELAGESLVVIEIPAAAAPPELTAAERAVVELALAGLSNQEIAARRGRAGRTIANQLASVYRKLGVSGRAELAARLAGDDG